jgi:hypothetical protein
MHVRLRRHDEMQLCKQSVGVFDEIGIVWMAMRHWRVTLPVSVWFARGISLVVSTLVMIVVRMAVLMFDWATSERPVEPRSVDWAVDVRCVFRRRSRRFSAQRNLYSLYVWVTTSAPYEQSLECGLDPTASG